jgi:hypothetical protein
LAVSQPPITFAVLLASVLTVAFPAYSADTLNSIEVPGDRAYPERARSGWGARRATSSWSVFILESRHTRTLDGPGKASPEHAIREQLTRAANAKRWPEQLQA